MLGDVYWAMAFGAWPKQTHNSKPLHGLIPYGNGNNMVSINFASLKGGLPGLAKARVCWNMYWAMAISRRPLDFALGYGPGMATARGHDHGWGNGLIPYVMVMVW